MAQNVQIAVEDKARESLPETLAKQGQLLAVSMIYQTDKYVFIDYAGQTLRLRNEDVRLLSVVRPAPTAAAASNPKTAASAASASAMTASPVGSVLRISWGSACHPHPDRAPQGMRGSKGAGQVRRTGSFCLGLRAVVQLRACASVAADSADGLEPKKDAPTIQNEGKSP